MFYIYNKMNHLMGINKHIFFKSCKNVCAEHLLINLLANSFGLDFSRRNKKPKIELAEKHNIH